LLFFITYNFYLFILKKNKLYFSWKDIIKFYLNVFLISLLFQFGNKKTDGCTPEENHLTPGSANRALTFSSYRRETSRLECGRWTSGATRLTFDYITYKILTAILQIFFISLCDNSACCNTEQCIRFDESGIFTVTRSFLRYKRFS